MSMNAIAANALVEKKGNKSRALASFIARN